MILELKEGMIYMPPFSGKTSVIKRALNSGLKIGDTDYCLLSHYDKLDNSELRLLRSKYSIILTNRIELHKRIACALIPSDELVAQALLQQIDSKLSRNALVSLANRVRYQDSRFLESVAALLPTFIFNSWPYVTKDTVVFTNVERFEIFKIQR